MYLTSKNFKDQGLDLSKVDYISKADFAKYFRSHSKALTQPLAGDILLGIIGSLGAPYSVKAGDHFGLSSSVAIIRPDTNKLHPLYLYYWIKGPILQSAIYGIKGGVAQGYLSLEMIKSLPLSYPPLSTQRKIAAILSAYDDLIENNTRRIKILEEMAQSLYREWFVHFRYPGHEGVRLVESELGLVPEGWELRPLGQLAQEVRRSVNPLDIDPETPYFGLEHLPRKSIALSQWGTAKDVQSTKLAFRRGEILFGKIRPYFHKVGVAPVNGVCSSDTIVISPKSVEYFGVVLGCVSSEDFINHATQTSQGTKMPRANWDILVKYPVAVATLPILKQFNDLVRDQVSLVENLVRQTRNLRHTRDLLLPKLLAGGVDLDKVVDSVNEEHT